MAEINEKKKQLDDEMSRFEAEILGPSPSDALPPPPAPPGMKTIIGTNTFNKVQQQLQHTNDTPSLIPPPPCPPSFSLPSVDVPPRAFRPPSPIQAFRPPENGPRAFRPPENGPRAFCPPENGPRGFHPPHENGPPVNFRPPFDNMPPRNFHPSDHGPRPFPPNFGPSPMGPMGPRHMGHGFMGPPNRPMGPGPHFMGNGDGPPPRFHPPPPPGFIPPQINRPPCGPMMPGGMMHPRQCTFINPPPPPPGLLMGDPKITISSPAIITKAPTIISSAPKLYTSKAFTPKSVEKKLALSQTEVAVETVSEQKKKKLKTEPEQLVDSMSIAIEMAEKVKQSTVTTKFTPKSSSEDKKKDKKSKKNLRYAGGQVWEDSTLGEWDHGDFRLFAGDLGNDVTDELLNRYFSHYPSFLKAKVVRDKRTNKSKGYGFISFSDSHDYIKAMKEINGKYVGSRPIKLRKSMWKERSFDVVQKKIKEKQLIGLK